MIPASYLFKQVYRQHWDEPDAPVVVERNHSVIDGLLSPLAVAASALLRRPTRSPARHLARHAHD